MTAELPHPAPAGAGGMARSAAVVFACRILGLVTGIVAAMLVAKHYGPDIYGRISYALAFVELFEVIAVLGTTIVITRELVLLRDHAAADFWRNALVTRLALVITAIVSMWCAAWFFWRQHPATFVMLMWASLGLLSSVRSAYQAVLRAWEKATWSAYVNLGRALSYMACIALLVICNQPGLRVIQASVAVTWIALLWDRRLAQRFIVSGGHATRSGVMDLMRRSYPLALSAVLTVIQVRIDILMLKAMSGDAAVGIYSAAMRLVESAYVFPVSLGVVVFPALTRAYAARSGELKHLFSNLLVTMLVFGIPFAVMTAYFASPIIQLLFGESFSSAAPVLVIMSMQVPLGFANICLVHTLFAAGRQKMELWASVATTLANVVANIILIPRLGPAGAALATVICQLVALCVLWVMVGFVIKPNVPARQVVIVVIMNILVYAACVLLGAVMHWLAAAFVIGVVYTMLAAATHPAARREIMRLVKGDPAEDAQETES